MFPTPSGLKMPDPTKPRLITHEEFEKILVRYEGAVNETEQQGDDSDEAVQELKEAREGLLGVLQNIKDCLED
jgi:hypothetical protein